MKYSTIETFTVAHLKKTKFLAGQANFSSQHFAFPDYYSKISNT